MLSGDERAVAVGRSWQPTPSLDSYDGRHLQAVD
jgi:hypothetical protein